jgi:hypothetical protein
VEETPAKERIRGMAVRQLPALCWTVAHEDGCVTHYQDQAEALGDYGEATLLAYGPCWVVVCGCGRTLSNRAYSEFHLYSELEALVHATAQDWRIAADGVAACWECQALESVAEAAGGV